MEQSQLLDRLLRRGVMRDGAAADAVLVLSAEDAADLDHLSMRLARLAPYQGRIEKMVMGK
jgi:hypothetical protein